MNNSDSADPYALILAQLEAQRSQIENAIATIKETRERFGTTRVPSMEASVIPSQPSSVGGHGVVIRADAYKDKNIPEAVKEYMTLRNRIPALFAEIVAALKAGNQSSANGENFGNVVFNALKRMEKRGELKRVNNRWAAGDWE